MARIPDAELEHLKAHTSVQRLVEAKGVKLTRYGKDLHGRCPFHDDRNASLSVNLRDERGGWRCFAGCGGGDLVGFHMRQTGKAFCDAVADLLGVRS